MVIKHKAHRLFSVYMFESRVVLDGNQTLSKMSIDHHVFESRVVLDGNQTR